MYNRYIPQPDGSYRRSHQPDRTPPRQESSRPSAKPDSPPCPPPEPTPPPRQDYPERRQPAPRPHGQSIGKFFRQLLPKNFDTADLLIVLLLLLMAGDDQEEQNNALLTLALYMFM